MKLGNLIVPLLIALIIIYGLLKKVDVFEVFVEGAKDGLLVAFRILPVLVGLLTAIGMLRASGALDALTSLCAPLTRVLGVPEQVLPLALLKPVSGSGSLAVLENLLTQFSPDSYIGRVACVMQGSTETTFYTIAVYYGAVKTTRTRCTLPCALIGDAVGLILSGFVVRLLFGVA